jgi:hypothetical protein
MTNQADFSFCLGQSTTLSGFAILTKKKLMQPEGNSTIKKKRKKLRSACVRISIKVRDAKWNAKITMFELTVFNGSDRDQFRFAKPPQNLGNCL